MWIFDSSIDKKMNSFALLLLRIVVGCFMLTHGVAKYKTLMDGGEFADPIGIGSSASLWLAVFAELVCSALLIIGFATRIAVVPLLITMIVAVFIVHSADPFGNKEVGGLYLIIYVLLLITGGGKYSIDGLIGKKNKKRGYY
ncbi:DoxX family protein [Flavobacterium akiainvivens]|uniref:DoxX family protein n=1 Tax=Flavobacterium akiainvivens TaxID=1202724 RepID=A0A0N0RQR6_9FLAO|nr:DoxX family protein [Flavobacterium akiainvivens]KOS06222.1 DoxX family protein [Flavobacterium akiainvivens]SFQ68670.1 putative oxidoreductase [Flavobacterium akiainvivens]